jgi:transposase InsO family protein
MVLPPRFESASSAEAVFRYQVVAHVAASMRSGEKQLEAVRAAAARNWLTFDGKLRRVGKRTIYRWLAAFEAGGLAALEPTRRARTSHAVVLPDQLMRFVGEQKQLDVSASIPELIRRARELGVIGADARIDRSTVYRTAQRMDIPVARRKGPRERDARRFAFPHRMDCVLCDGKHFRAGPTRAKRVALFFLDDATRYGLHVVVGTSESAELFLRGLYELVRRHGLMQIVFLDRGPGFIATESFEVVGKLGALLIHGEKAYPEGHGKIERLNQTANAQSLRGLDRRPDVDAECGALELRLGHYLSQRYNHTPHESLDGDTPFARFTADPKPLSFPDSDEDLRRRFVMHLERTASKDHIVSIDGIGYEVPRGLADRRLTIHHRLLDHTFAVVAGAKLVELSPVDLSANARSRRAREDAGVEPIYHPLPRSAADLAFDRDFRPIVAPDGGFSDPDPDT